MVAKKGTARKATGAVAKGTYRRTMVARVQVYCTLCGSRRPNGSALCDPCGNEYEDFLDQAGIHPSPHSLDLFRVYRLLAEQLEIKRIKEKYS